MVGPWGYAIEYTKGEWLVIGDWWKRLPGVVDVAEVDVEYTMKGTDNTAKTSERASQDQRWGSFARTKCAEDDRLA